MRIAFDSCTFTRFLEANNGARSDVHIDVYRIAMYAPTPPYLPPRVWQEYQRIREPLKHNEHWRFAVSFFQEDVENVAEHPDVLLRVDALRALHPPSGRREPGDCHVLAECEAMGLDVLVSTDCDFVKRLSGVANLALVLPGQCWRELAIPARTQPLREPRSGHPLAGTTYWHA